MKSYIRSFVSIVLAAVVLARPSASARASALLPGTVDTVLEYDGELHMYSSAPVNLVIDGQPVTGLSMPPVILNDSVLVPVRDVFERIGAVVDWKPENREIFIGYGQSLIILQIDGEFANVNGSYMQLSVPPKIINGRTMVPLRFAAQSFGFLVDWYPNTRTASIFTGSEGGAFGAAPAPTPPPAQNPWEVRPAYPSPLPGGTAGDQAQVSYEDPGESVIDLTPRIPDQVSTDERARDISLSDIPEIVYPDTVLTGFRTQNAGSHSFVIEANSEIRKVTKTLLPDNRLFLDIFGAENWLDKQYAIEGNPAIASVRTAQNQVEPEKITRIVFDLQAAVNYSITISPDRKSIYVNMQRTTVTNASFTASGADDLITVEFTESPGVNTYMLTNPYSLVIDIPLADMRFSYAQPVNGRFASAMTAAQLDENTGRVTLELRSVCAFSVSYEGNRALIRLSDATYRNIEYDNANRTVKLRKDPSAPISAGQITHNDQYTLYKYTLTLPGNYSGVFGGGEYVVRDQFLTSFDIQTNSAGLTELVMNQRQVLAYNVTEDAEYIYIRLMLPREKYPRIVIVDPGHGGFQPGTSGFNMVEKEINLDIAAKLMALFARDGYIKAYATRLDDTYVDLEDRAIFANVTGDMLVSVHINSVEEGRSSATNGREVFYYPHGNDAYIGFTSQALAEALQKSLVNALGSRDRKAQEKELVVLTDTTVPAALAEIGFITNPEEAARLATESYRQQAAEALYMGIVEAFGRYVPRR